MPPALTLHHPTTAYHHYHHHHPRPPLTLLCCTALRVHLDPTATHYPSRHSLSACPAPTPPSSINAYSIPHPNAMSRLTRPSLHRSLAYCAAPHCTAGDTSDKLRIYVSEACPFSHRILIAAAEKGVDYDVVFVDVSQKEVRGEGGAAVPFICNRRSPPGLSLRCIFRSFPFSCDKRIRCMRVAVNSYRVFALSIGSVHILSASHHCKK